ncbi:MAG TPA: M23 family metallopeptidase, partial [Candidatus Acidoferrum sp.]
ERAKVQRMNRFPIRFLSALMAVTVVSLVLPRAKSEAQVVKRCPEGLTMKLSTGITAQGTLLLAEVVAGRAMPEVKGEWTGREMALWTEGGSGKTLHGLIGIDLEKPVGKYEWTISWKNKGGEELSCSEFVSVRTGKFPTEQLKVEKQFVEPDVEQQKRAKADQEKMKAIYDTVTAERLWDGAFHLPLKDVATGGNFGRRRVLNGQARSPHAGVDFPALKGTPVYAAQSGKVVLAEELYYSGNTVVIDHGYGVYTLYAHLSEIDVKAGEAVRSEAEIGKVGATGRVTGPHLHWGLTVQHARVNAMQIVARIP